MNISDSVNLILREKELLGGKFYDVFFSEFPEIKIFFDGVDMERQAAVLTTSLVLVETIYSKDGAALKPYLKHLGKQHQERDISAEDYDKWLHAMMKTLESYHGEDWNEPLAKQWSAALEQAVRLMISGYDD